jgi:hypothetical protein
VEERIFPVSIDIRAERPNGVRNPAAPMSVIRKGPARKHPERQAHIDLAFRDEREQFFSPREEKAADSETVERPVRVEMDQGLL